MSNAHSQNAPHIAAPQPLMSSRCGSLTGDIAPPGDKSISHRAIMLGGIAEGVTRITGLLEGEDVLRTVAALRSLGAEITRDASGTAPVWTVKGAGLAGLKAPDDVLDMGNSGTAARLLIGLLAGRPFTSRFTGDASLQKRPMGRIMLPLGQMGATFDNPEGRLPLAVTGSADPKPLRYVLPVASAQVKSAILLAGLSVEGVTTVVEHIPTRDHSENMLRWFGAHLSIEPQPDGGEAISLIGRPTLSGQDIAVPADISSAAFPLVAALLRPDSQLLLRKVGINPRRAGLIKTLIEMGADIQLQHLPEEGGEPVADIAVKGSRLHGIDVPADRAPSMIDEYPILAVAATCAAGTTRMRGLGELRVKESDRLALMAEGLQRCGVTVAIDGDDLIVQGDGQPPRGCLPDGPAIATAMDHRIAMSFLVLGSATVQPVRIDDGGFIGTSFPGFVEMMNGLCMKIA
jgi:3-phosphoshikimate 1-carboxyvinyltransferase